VTTSGLREKPDSLEIHVEDLKWDDVIGG